jgi:hypothetical protein
VVTNTFTMNSDGSDSQSSNTTTYSYDPQTKLNNVTGNGTFTNNDGFNNITTGTSVSEYDLALLSETGQARIQFQSTRSNTLNQNLGTAFQYLVVENVYDNFDASLVSATGQGITRSFNGYEEHTVGRLDQTYAVING